MQSLWNPLKNALDRIITCVEQLKHLLETAPQGEKTEKEKELEAEIQGYVKKYEESMEDDFNTADAIAAIFELVKFSNTQTSGESTGGICKGTVGYYRAFKRCAGASGKQRGGSIRRDIERLIEECQTARKEKNFKRADEIRDQLADMGIILKDTREGVQWKRA